MDVNLCLRVLPHVLLKEPLGRVGSVDVLVLQTQIVRSCQCRRVDSRLLPLHFARRPDVVECQGEDEK